MSKRKKMQRDKALNSDKKIWAIQVIMKEYCQTWNDAWKDGKGIMVYVVDNSMARAIQKAIYYYGRKTGIKSIKVKEHYKHDKIQINFRRATKMEIINTRAGMGLDFTDGESKRFRCLEVI